MNKSTQSSYQQKFAVPAIPALFDNPAVAIPIALLLFSLGQLITSDTFTYQFLLIANAGEPRRLLLDVFRLDLVLDKELTIAMANRISFILFLTNCVVVIGISRCWPKARDAATFIGGSLWILAVAGWEYVVSMCAITVIVHYGFRRLHSHVSMLLTLIPILICFKYFIPDRVPGGDSLTRISTAAVHVSMVWGALRLVMYAFENSSVSPRERSLLTVLAYSPLGLFLWPGEPPMTSYLMYAAKRTRAVLDRLGSRQLYRSAFKYLLIVCLARIMLNVLPTGSSFTTAPLEIKLCAFILGPALFYLRISLVADFACGLSSFAGYHVENAFDSPFLADNLIKFWQSWNIPVLSFLRRAFIFPLAKWHRSAVLTIISAMVGTILLHSCLEWLLAGPRLTFWVALSILKARSSFYSVLGILLICSIPFYQRVNTRKLPARIISIIFTQCIMAWILVGTLSSVRGVPRATHLIWSSFMGVF